MLNVDGCIDVNAVVEQFQNILISLGVSAAWRVGVCKFVHKNELWFACKNRVEVHFLESGSLVVESLSWDDCEAFKKSLGLRPFVCLDVPNNNINPLRLCFVR